MLLALHSRKSKLFFTMRCVRGWNDNSGRFILFHVSYASRTRFPGSICCLVRERLWIPFSLSCAKHWKSRSDFPGSREPALKKYLCPLTRCYPAFPYRRVNDFELVLRYIPHTSKILVLILVTGNSISLLIHMNFYRSYHFCKNKNWFLYS